MANDPSAIITIQPSEVSAQNVLLPVAAMKRAFGLKLPDNGESVTIDGKLLHNLLQIVSSTVPLDEAFYLSKYPDVAEAISRGNFKNVRHHFGTFGFFEGRQPFEIVVDEEFYLKANPDIKRSIRDGHEKSGQSHYDRYGWKEGRLPYANFNLLMRAR
jgi:hypothetical protein